MTYQSFDADISKTTAWGSSARQVVTMVPRDTFTQPCPVLWLISRDISFSSASVVLLVEAARTSLSDHCVSVNCKVWNCEIY